MAGGAVVGVVGIRGVVLLAVGCVTAWGFLVGTAVGWGSRCFVEAVGVEGEEVFAAADGIAFFLVVCFVQKVMGVVALKVIRSGRKKLTGFIARPERVRRWCE